jgi:hypothetical protein
MAYDYRASLGLESVCIVTIFMGTHKVYDTDKWTSFWSKQNYGKD